MSFVAAELDASLDDGVVVEDELLLDDGELGVDGDMLELELDDGVLDVPVVALDELDVSVDGVDGDIVLELELLDGVLGVVVVDELELDAGGVVDGVVVVVDDVLAVSFWQPAAAIAAAMARTAKGFGFICSPPDRIKAGVRCCVKEISRIGAIGCARTVRLALARQLVRRQWDAAAQAARGPPRAT